MPNINTGNGTSSFSSWLNTSGNKLLGVTGKDALKTNAFGLTQGGTGLAAGALNVGNSLLGATLNSAGNSSDAGNAMTQIGSLASNIPGVGGLVGAGISTLGTIVNAGFGNNINHANVDEFKNQAETQGSYASGAVDTASLLEEYNNFRNLAEVSKSDVGSDGWFSNRASKLTKDINEKRKAANTRAFASLGNTAENIDVMNDSLKAANYFVDGGKLNLKDPKITEFNAGGTHEENSLGGIPQGKNADGNTNLVEQGEVKYNDYIFSNRLKVPGTDTTFASKVKEQLKEAKERPNDPLNKKYLNKVLEELKGTQERVRATLQEPSSSSEGVFREGGDMTADKETPSVKKQLQDAILREGKKLGYSNAALSAILGNIQLESGFNPSIEEDDSLYDTTKRKGGIGLIQYTGNRREDYEEMKRKTSDWDIDDEASYLFKDIENGWSSKKSKEKFKRNGDLSKAVTLFTKYNLRPHKDYEALDKRLSAASKFYDPANDALYATASSDNNINTDMANTKEMKNVSFSPAGLPTQMNENTNMNKVKTNNRNSSGLAALRYAPVVGGGLQVLSDILGLTNKPQYEASDTIKGLSTQMANSYTPVSYTPIGEKMKYTPTDTRQSIADLQALSSAAFSKTSGNPLSDRASRLATTYNTQRAIGDVLQKGSAADMERQAQVLNFNRGTDSTNAQLGMQVANINAANRLKALQGAASLGSQAAVLRQQAYNTSDNAKTANLSNLFTNLGAVGKEQGTRDLMAQLADLGVLSVDSLGNFNRK